VTYKNITILKFKAVCPVLVHTRYPYYQIPCRKAASRDRQKLAGCGRSENKKLFIAGGRFYQMTVTGNNPDEAGLN